MKYLIALAVLALLKIHVLIGTEVEIVRGKYDKFTNIFGCKISKAVCFNSTCNYCTCTKHETFVMTRGKNGECVKTDLLLYATDGQATFLMENNGVCFHRSKHGSNMFITGGQCSENDEMHWIISKFGQIIHWKTLQCLSDTYHSWSWDITRSVLLDECVRTNKKQLWKCIERTYYVENVNTQKYLTYEQSQEEVTTSSWYYVHYNGKWKPLHSNESICQKAIGCEIFQDGEPIVILDKEECAKEKFLCLGEKKMMLQKKNECVIQHDKSQYLYNDTWKNFVMKDKSLSIDTWSYGVTLKWNLTNTPQAWEGLIVQIKFRCQQRYSSRATEHCAMIKYAGTFKGFVEANENDGLKNSIKKEEGNGSLTGYKITTSNESMANNGNNKINRGETHDKNKAGKNNIEKIDSRHNNGKGDGNGNNTGDGHRNDRQKEKETKEKKEINRTSSLNKGRRRTEIIAITLIIVMAVVLVVNLFLYKKRHRFPCVNKTGKASKEPEYMETSWRG
ncbi:uncharacterized protein LOC124458003 isoform X2 [Xenia sp. Carnegie-2017]|uniref:uncharacterized protein LOC124458003 isoform X2 n=1 Tax=Xenia sp. Carnegie-2017 TaxID=2897299 RepID=UPI001F03FB9F|nr:uncharacterized protein LOC124458003 isoform X2 [Xenia sp. Carnegie-2017]